MREEGSCGCGMHFPPFLLAKEGRKEGNFCALIPSLHLPKMHEENGKGKRISRTMSLNDRTTIFLADKQRGSKLIFLERDPPFRSLIKSGIKSQFFVPASRELFVHHSRSIDPLLHAVKRFPGQNDVLKTQNCEPEHIYYPY